MTATITRDVLEGHLRCKTKGRLKLAGECGQRSDYQALLDELRAEARAKAAARLLSRHDEGEVLRALPADADVLRRGAAFLLDATLTAGDLSLTFDGLRKVPGDSDLGDFHYAPVLFHGGGRVGPEQRSLLAVLGSVLGGLQGRLPGHGYIFRGREGRAARVRLGQALYEKARRTLAEIRELAGGGQPPRLALNPHCPVCEFRQRCQAQAAAQDDLSLLRGLGEKERKGYARKGIFTLNQLAHTFRPRRKGRKDRHRPGKRQHALQAKALRDRRVYVLGSPVIPASPARIYLDLEGKPD